MAIAFQALDVRAARRLRLVFTNELDSGAFSPTWFTLESVDGSGADPTVKAALAIPNTPNGLELVLDEDLAEGGLYELTIAAGLPAVDLSTLALTVQQFRPAEKPAPPSPEVSAADLLALVYGVDLVHDGTDFVKQANGDLAAQTGPENVKAWARRATLSDGVPWDDSFGAKLRRYVDAPIPTLGRARGAVVQQLRRDDRITRADAAARPDDNTGEVIVDVDIRLVGDIREQVQVER